jgi:hypothetical protein
MATKLVSNRLYANRNPSNPRSNAFWTRTRGFRERGAFSSRGLRRYIARVGTKVRDKIYDASMAKITASASG